MSRRKYADQGLAVMQGFQMGRQAVKDIQDDQVRSEIGDAAQANRVTESVSGEEAAKIFNENYIPQEGGPATAAEYLQQNPGVADALSPDRKAGYAVGKDTFDNRGAAQAKANGLNLQGMADVLGRNGRPEDAMKLQQQGRQGELTELQIKGAERADREAGVEEEYKLSRQKLSGEFSGNRIRGENDALMSQFEQAQAAYQEALKANPGNPAAAGMAPTKPKLRTMTGLDMLHDANLLMQHDMKYGKVDPAKALQYQQMVGQVKKEVSVDAFKLLHSGNIDGAVKAFDEMGDLRIPQGAKLEARKAFYEVGGQKVPTNEIVVHLPNGHIQVINGLQGMDSLDAADKIIGNNFKGAELGLSKQRVGIDGARLSIAETEASRAKARWEIEKPTLEGAAEDSKQVRVARKELVDAIDSGDADRIEKAKAKATAAGIKFDKPNNEFVSTTDSMGLNVTRTNKDTGQVDIINPKSGQVTTIPAPGAKPAAAASAVPPANQRKIGQVYDTPRGKLIWRGSGWEAAK